VLRKLKQDRLFREKYVTVIKKSKGYSFVVNKLSSENVDMMF
jgi:hypothetical protein